MDQLKLGEPYNAIRLGLLYQILTEFLNIEDTPSAHMRAYGAPPSARLHYVVKRGLHG